MAAVFLVSDTHFGHAGVCRFTDSVTGEKIRPWTDPAEMDEEMVKRWNETVRPNDKVYHLGDVVINRKALSIMSRLNGDKVHGHLHTGRVMAEIWGKWEIDPRYHCVCVEQTDFRPILFEDVIKRIKEEGGEVGFKNGNGPTM